MSENNIKKSFGFSRREIVKGLGLTFGLTGAAGVMAGLFQNCGQPASFGASPNSTNLASSGCTFSPTPPLCSQNANYLSGKPVQASLSGDEHHISAGLYAPSYFDFQTGAYKIQNLLAITVGPNPSAGIYHPTNYTDLTAIHSITDIFIINKDTCEFLLWKRFNNGDPNPFALMMLPADLVASRAQLKVVVSCSVHGFFGVDLDLGSSPMDYNSLVGTYDPSLAFGGSTLSYPYVPRSATGGQGDLGTLHAPQIVKVSDSEITAILGGSVSPHGRFAENHYIGGGAIFDQNGHLLAPPIFIRYSDAGDATHGPTLDFTNLNLSQRGIHRLRVVLFDTFNGMLQSFQDV